MWVFPKVLQASIQNTSGSNACGPFFRRWHKSDLKRCRGYLVWDRNIKSKDGDSPIGSTKILVVVSVELLVSRWSCQFDTSQLAPFFEVMAFSAYDATPLSSSTSQILTTPWELTTRGMLVITSVCMDLCYHLVYQINYLTGDGKVVPNWD